MVLIALFLFFNVFMFVLDRNTAFQDSASQANQLLADRIAEKFTLSTPTYIINDTTHQVSVSVNVINVSPLSVLIKSMWITDSAAANPNYNYSAESIALQPGQSAILTAAVVISDASSLDIGSCTSWFVTARGNTISTIQSESTIGSGSGNGACAAILFGVSGANTTSPFDGNAASYTGGPPVYGQTNGVNPSITTTVAHDIIITVLGVQNGNTAGVQVNNPSGYKNIGSPQLDASKSRYTAAAAHVYSVTGTYNPSWAWQSSGTWGVITDAMKQSASGTIQADTLSFSTFVTSGNTLTLTLKPSYPNEVLYLVWVGNAGQTITAVSTAGGSPSTTSWNMRAIVSADDGGNHLLETWYATSTAANQLYYVIITMSNSVS